jgi:hypothetical protein
VMFRLDSPGEVAVQQVMVLFHVTNWTRPLLLLSKWGGDRVAIGEAEVFHVPFGEE